MQLRRQKLPKHVQWLQEELAHTVHQHFWDALSQCGTEATAERDPHHHEAHLTPAPHQCRANTKASTDTLCAGELNTAAEGATHLLPVCRRHQGKVEENEERFYLLYFLIYYYLHIPMVQAHTKEDYQERS